MKKLLFRLALSILFLSNPALAQQKSGNLKGRAIDEKAKAPVEMVAYAVKNVKDSTVTAMGATTKEGIFSAKALPLGQYKFYMALIGYKPILKLFEVTPEKTAIDFGDILLQEEAITLNAVLIKGELLPMIIKKDTVEFNADAFKTQADASLEDALKVMPGMEVDKDGGITFNGRKIDKVMVEGRDFFGNDPKMATRNLPKDIISKIQVIERKTDDAIFKGVDDGKRENVLNVTLKEDKKKGVFGNVASGKANGNLYDASVNINRFNKKRQISIISMANNLNKTSFSFSDLSEFLGGDVFGSGIPMSISMGGMGVVSVSIGGGDFGFDGGGGGGINDNKGIGFNYNDEWGKNPKFPYKITGNYTGNRNYGIRESLTSRLNLLGTDSYYNDRETDITTTSIRHRVSFRLDLPIDSMNKLQISPNFGFSSGDSKNAAIFSSYTEQNNNMINEGNSLSSNKSKVPGYGGRILYNRKFTKKGRTMSVTANGNFSESILDGLNYSNITINSANGVSSTLLNQLIDQNGSVNSYGLSGEYTEPLSKKISLTSVYNFSKRDDLIERVVYDYDQGTTSHKLFNKDLSRNLSNYTKTNSVNFRLNYIISPKLNFTINTTQKLVGLIGENKIDQTRIANSYYLFESTFYMSYKLSKVASLNFNGSRYNSIPSVSQLQPITDNSNPLSITTGNPNLKPGANNGLSIYYFVYNPNNSSSLDLSLNYFGSPNRIANKTILDPKTGIQTTTYDNIDGTNSYNFRIGNSFKIKSLGLTISPSLNVGLGQNMSFLNGEEVASKSRNFILGTNIGYVVGSVLQFSNRISYSKRQVSYAYNNLPNQDFTSVNNNLSLSATLPYDFRFNLSSYVTYNSNVNLGSNNATIHQAEVSMEKLFLKKSLSLKGSVSDVFNNSRNSYRSASEMYITESVNLGMRRYFLLSLSYRLKKFGGSSPAPAPTVIRFN